MFLRALVRRHIPYNRHSSITRWKSIFTKTGFNAFIRVWKGSPVHGRFSALRFPRSNGLRWSKHVVDLDHVGLRDLEHVVRGRNTTIHDFTFDEGSKRVDDFLDIQTKEKDLVRPDLYRQQRQPSPYHPGGYQHQRLKDERDPTGHAFDRPDTRPEDFREPPFDSKYRGPVDQVPTRGLSPEVINIGPRMGPPTLQTLPNSGFSNPSKTSKPEEIEIQQMKYEQPATKPRPESSLANPAGKPATAPPPAPAKPKMFKLPTIGNSKK